MIRMMIALAAVLAGAMPLQQPAGGRTLVFVLAGQSNMVGHGDAVELSDELRRAPANVRLYLAGEPAELAARPRFGPEVAFAHVIARAHPDDTIVLIKHAVGGSSLLAWAPEWSAEGARLTGNEGQGPLYRTLLEQVAAVRAGLPVDARFEAVLWMQGERDARFEAAGAQYASNLETLVERLRADLEAPDLPFILGRVNPPAERYPATAAVRAAQDAAATRIPATIVVSTDDLGMRDDDLHFNAAGQLELGRRFARAYLDSRR